MGKTLQELTKQLQIQEASLGRSSNDIHDAVIRKISKLDIKKDSKICDIGCGSGELAAKLAKRFSFTNIDAIDGILYKDIENPIINFKQINLESSELESLGQKYDLITCTEVIEHMDNPWSFIIGLSKIMTKNAHLILTTPNPESWRSILNFTLRGYHSAFGPKDRPAHKLAISAYDLEYMAIQSTSLAKIEIDFITNGTIPGSLIKWNRFLPFLTGKRYSDNYLGHFQKAREQD